MTDTTQQTELEALKERADLMGIKYSPNIGVDTLREKVNAQLETEETGSVKVGSNRYQALRREAMKLVRVRVTNLNPSKKESEAEFVRAGNRLVSASRLVPFETETHIENILLNVLKGRQYCIVVHEKNSEGKKVPVRKMRKEFQIEELPPLTEKELQELKESQIKRNAI
ncbi:hypothetical protein VPHD292_0022 [Vibrio phage D292]